MLFCLKHAGADAPPLLDVVPSLLVKLSQGEQGALELVKIFLAHAFNQRRQRTAAFTQQFGKHLSAHRPELIAQAHHDGVINHRGIFLGEKLCEALAKLLLFAGHVDIRLQPAGGRRGWC